MNASVWRLAALMLVGASMHASVRAGASGLFFDDFRYADAAALRAGGWRLRDAPGHPGVPGARWSPQAIDTTPTSLADGPAGDRLLRLSASTDGLPTGTTQAQLCHGRKLLQGTYAARLRLADQPLAGMDGDPVVMAFYAATPLRFDFDPEFSEIDWEYLPNGGWGSPETRLYGIAWQTARLEPWEAHNAAHVEPGSLDGWHTLVVQVEATQSHWFLNGRALATHGGRNHPVRPMAMALSLWFSPGGLLAPSTEPRQWQMEVDWVLHAAGQTWSPAQVQAEVQALRQAGVARWDSVPEADPPLPSRCDF